MPDKRILIQMMFVLRFRECLADTKRTFVGGWPSQNNFHWTIFVSCFFVTKIQEAVFVREWFDAFPRPHKRASSRNDARFRCGPIQNLQLASPESIGNPKFRVPKKIFLSNSCSVDRNTKMTQSNTIQLDSISSAMDVAYLYRNTDASLGWTSTLSWKADQLLGLKTCPVTGESVGMVCDGVVAVALSKGIANKETTEECEVIRFKYGKKRISYRWYPREVTKAKLINDQHHPHMGMGGLGCGSEWVPAGSRQVPTQYMASHKIE